MYSSITAAAAMAQQRDMIVRAAAIRRAHLLDDSTVPRVLGTAGVGPAHRVVPRGPPARGSRPDSSESVQAAGAGHSSSSSAPAGFVGDPAKPRRHASDAAPSADVTFVFAPDWMQPRDRAEAARTVLLLSSVAALVTVLVALLRPQQAGGLVVALGVVLPGTLLVVLGAYALTRAKAEAPLAWTVFPVLTVLVVAALDVATGDASTAAQVFLFFPVLYGAYNLPRAGAMVLAGVAAVSDVAIALSILPARAALVDIVYVVAALVTSAGVLVHASERRAALVAMLQRQAAIDPLTGLATRRVLDQTANSVLSGASAHTGTGLILVDVDHFKTVNDRFGHWPGTRCWSPSPGCSTGTSGPTRW